MEVPRWWGMAQRPPLLLRPSRSHVVVWTWLRAQGRGARVLAGFLVAQLRSHVLVAVCFVRTPSAISCPFPPRPPWCRTCRYATATFPVRLGCVVHLGQGSWRGELLSMGFGCLRLQLRRRGVRPCGMLRIPSSSHVASSTSRLGALCSPKAARRMCTRLGGMGASPLLGAAA